MEKSIALYELQLETLSVTEKGTAPLICHRFSERAQEQIEGKQQGAAKRGKAPRDPDAEMSDSCYRLPDGQFGFPGIAFKQAIVRAAKAAGIAMTDARGAFQISGDLLPLRAGDPQLRADRVVIGKQTTTIAYRPQFWPWEIDLEILYNVRSITAEQLINLLELAGFGVGVGDWRPECNGQFGRFQVKRQESNI